MLEAVQHPYLSYQASKKTKMSKYLLLSLVLHVIILVFMSIKPIRDIFKHELDLRDISQLSSPPTLQMIIEEAPIPPPIERQYVYTDASNADESQVVDTPFESAHNTRLTSTEAPSRDLNQMLPQQTGDPNMGLSISQEEGMTNIPTAAPQPQLPPTPPEPEPLTKTNSSPPAQLRQEHAELITENEIDEGTLIEEREAMRRATKKEALKQAQALKKESRQETQQETLPETLRRPARENTERARHVEETRAAPTIARARSNIQGGGERSDITSIGSRASPVGRYKSMLYMEVGSRWNQEIDRRGGPSTLPLGSVRIAFTVKHTGEITDIRVVSRSASNNIVALENLCLYAIRATSPFEPFDKAVREQLGDSYREEFTFTIYR